MVKDKPNSTRLYDEDGYRRRAACVCINSNDPNQVSHQFANFQNQHLNNLKKPQESSISQFKIKDLKRRPTNSFIFAL